MQEKSFWLRSEEGLNVNLDETEIKISKMSIQQVRDIYIPEKYVEVQN